VRAEESPGKVVIGLVQMSMTEDPEENIDRAVRLVSDAARMGAKLICLPELFSLRYFCQSEDVARFTLAESIPGPTTRRLEALALELEVTLITSIFESRAAGIYHNTAVVIDAERGYIGKYRKMHIPDDPGYHEKFYFTPGDLGFRSFSTAAGECGVLICWDQWYPEAARLTVLRGAQILVYPTAIGWHPEEKKALGAQQEEAWKTVQRSHGIANGCFVAAVNRVGFEPAPDGVGGIEFWGQSFVSAPDGRVISAATSSEDGVTIAELDFAEIGAARVGWPFLRDRRIDAYGDLVERYLDDRDATKP